MIGAVVGNYEITEKIGEGGMGAVFKGIDVMLEREVAIKMLRPELARQPNIVERFRTEAVTLAKLNHPNIATLYSFLRQGDDYFMVMEYVRGETLEAVLQRFGAMQCERAVSLFCQALDGIDHAHKMGIIHRDIKASNLMLTEAGSIKVMDFGIARMLGTSRITRHGKIVGTIEYMPPEQIRGEETDARSDIYSLGILLYEMLTNRLPFDDANEFELMKAQLEKAAAPPSSLVTDIPLGVEKAIMRALAKKRDARFQTAAEFSDALLTALRVSANDTARNYRAPVTRISEPLPDIPFAWDETAPVTMVDPDSNPLHESPETIVREKEFPDRDPLAVAGLESMSKPLPAQANSHAPRRPFFSRLQFKHYVWIAAAILLLSGLRILFIRGGASASPPASVGVEQPAASAPAASEPVASAPAAPPDQSASPAAPQPDARPSNNAATEDNSNSVNSNASPQRPTRAARVETRRREKKAGGIGGFIKKLNPLKLNPFKGKKKQ